MRQLEAMEKIFAKNRKNRILPEAANGGTPKASLYWMSSYFANSFSA